MNATDGERRRRNEPTRRSISERYGRLGLHPERWSRTTLRFATLAVVAVAYYATARVSLNVALVEGQVTPIWPPTGIAVVAMLILGPEVWPGVALGAFLVNVPLSRSLVEAAVIACGNTLAPVAAVALLRWAGFRAELERLRDAMALVFLGALAATTISASAGTSALAVSGTISPSAFWPTWSVWWTGDAMGVLVVAPFLLSLRPRGGPARWSWRIAAEAGALAAGLTVVVTVVFHSGLQLTYLVFPFLLWAAWRFGLRGAAPAALLTSGLAIWAAVRGAGPFAHQTLFDKMVTLQLFNASFALMSLVLAALVAERSRAEKESRRSAARVMGLVASAPDGILIVAPDGRIQVANPQAERIFGYSSGTLAGVPVEDLVPDALRGAHTRHRADYLRDPTSRPMGLGLDLAGRRKDGTEFPVEIGLSSFTTPDGRLVTCIVSDITERKRAAEGIAYLAYHDTLTGLPNRAMFGEHLELALARARRTGRAVAVVYLDLDDFKLINDTFGHAAGDEVLRAVAVRLRDVARETDLLCRQGGDEFLVLLADLDRSPGGETGDTAAIVLAGRIHAALAAPFMIRDTKVSVSTSIGICETHSGAVDAATLLSRADEAMYRAKRRGPGGTAVPRTATKDRSSLQ